jgi:hypothetical protein
MTDTVVRTDDATYQRDAELYRVISQHPFKPIVWDIAPEQWAELRASFARIFGWLAGDDAPADQHCRTEVKRKQPAALPTDDARDDQRKQSDAAVLLAIRRNSAL